MLRPDISLHDVGSINISDIIVNNSSTWREITFTDIDSNKTIKITAFGSENIPITFGKID